MESSRRSEKSFSGRAFAVRTKNYLNHDLAGLGFGAVAELM